MPSVVDPGGLLKVPGRGSPGDRLGKYELVCRLAIGGMAEIFLARAQGIGGFEKLVVLKRILPQHANQEEFVVMFLAEARLTATLSHPNIANVYDIGIVDDSYFFTMEYVHGEDLNQVGKALARANRVFPLEHAITIINGICAGLHHAHEACGADGEPLGIVHRDVSPANVLIAYDGSVKLVDFGIAKMTTKTAATRVGTLKGKISYMSPEQCRGEPLDRRSDVFAIGILLYEMTTGHRLFPGENEFATLQAIVHQDVARPSTLVPEYPPMLEQIVMMALERDPDARYATAEDMQLDLDAFARHHGLSPSPVRLSKLMQELFGWKLAAWHDAQRAGRSLAEFLAGAMVREISATSEGQHTPTSGVRRRSTKRSSALPFDVPLGLDAQPADAARLLDDDPDVEIAVRRRSAIAWVIALAVLVAAGGAGVYAWDRLRAPDAAVATQPVPRGPTVTPIEPAPEPVPVPVPDPAAAAVAPEPAPEPIAVAEPTDTPAASATTDEKSDDRRRRKHRTKRADRKSRLDSPATKPGPTDPDSPFED